MPVHQMDPSGASAGSRLRCPSGAQLLLANTFHLHERQTDVWYVPPSDKLLLVLADVRTGSKSEGEIQMKRVGVDRVVGLRRLGSHRIASSILRPSAADFVELPG